MRRTTYIRLHRLLDEFAGKTLNHHDVATERATVPGGIVEGALRESARVALARGITLKAYSLGNSATL